MVGMLGAGSWGTALAIALSRNQVPVRLWGRNASLIEKVDASHENARYLPGFALSDTIDAVDSLEDALRCETIVIAVPSHAVRELLKQAASIMTADPSFSAPVWVMAAKGLEASSGLRMSEVAKQTLGGLASSGIVALSGPNLAVEVARGVHTASVAASSDEEASRLVQSLFNSLTLRVYTSQDVIGVELGGALKNALAIAAGISDALGYGDNTKGALLSRGLMEIARLGVSLGAKIETFLGLTGVGDLFATAASTLSRNYRVGYALGQGKALPQILEELGQVAEGVPTAHAALLLAKRQNVEMPILEAVAAVIDGKISPQESVCQLMSRAPKQEA